jgi:hypothetical protein
MKEEKISIIRIRGETRDEFRIITILINLIINPRNGGSPAIDKKLISRIILFLGDKFMLYSFDRVFRLKRNTNIITERVRNT